MSRLKPANIASLSADAQDMIKMCEQMMGFTPNDALIMARNPALLSASAALVGAVYGQGTLDPGLKRLIGYVNSSAAGCTYCQAHTAHGAHNAGVEAKKIAQALNYANSDVFSPAERAALRVAEGAGVSPNTVTDADFEALKQHYSEAEILEIVAVIAMFGFLNRWNSTLATDLEQVPGAFLKRQSP